MSITGSEQWMYSSGAAGFYGFPIEQSLRFNDNDSAYLSRSITSAGNRKTFTISCWVKRANLGLQGVYSARQVKDDTTALLFENDDKLVFTDRPSNVRNIELRTNRLFRDVGAWYHIVIKIDTTQATASDRVKMYVNGEEQTSFTTSNYPSQNYDVAFWNNSYNHVIGYIQGNSPTYFDGYLAEFNFIDGQALDPTSFGEFKSGIWIPKDPTGLTYGTNGFRLNFADTVTASGFNTLTYSGDNLNPKSVNGCGFSPDFVWVKQRTNNGGGATFHQLYDSVRGTQKLLRSNTTDVELANPSNGGVQSFDADGFTIQGSSASLNMNGSGETYVAWTWDAGSGSAASNTDGSITSTVKANTDYGFSIVSYTGTGSATSWGHGLGVQPDMVIVKNRSGTNNWAVYHSGVPATQALLLSATNAAFTTGYWNNTAPTSSIVNISGDGIVNTSGNNYIAYCFAEKTGFSSISSYTGDGTTDGSKTITTGFKPAFVMMKNASTGSTNWLMFDNTRDTKPTIELELNANNSNAEANNGRDVTFTDTGFTVAGNNNINGSGDTYIYMAFADTRDAAFWRDTSGQGNDWQPNNLVFSDVVPDAPSNNFATINNLASLGGMTFFEGNTKVRHADIAAYNHARSTMGMTTGKWYWEWYNSGSSGDAPTLLSGIVNDAVPVSTSNGYVGQNANSYSYSEQGFRYHNASNIGTISVPTGDSSGIWMLAYDADDGKLYVGKNGTWANSGNPATGTGALFTGIDTDTTWYPAGYTINNDAGRWRDVVVNHGQDSTFAGNKAAGGNADANGYGDFAYAPPSGFLSLCSANLPSGAIDTLADETPEDYFNTVLWTGDNTNNRSITGVGFQPSLVSAKSRSGNSGFNWVDAVRGGTKNLQSNTTSAEATTNTVISFDSDGFTVGDGNGYDINKSGESIVGWSWKAGGTGVSNTDGSITSTVSVGATSQQNWFSVATYTEPSGSFSFGHGLGVTPDMFIFKRRDGAENWIVWHKDFGSPTNNGLYLNLTDSTFASGSNWLTGIDNNTISITSGQVGGAGTKVCYSFANAEGLCKVGSYTGNSSADGSFIYTGFRPAFVLAKKYTAADDWIIHDNKRVDRGVDSNAIDDYLRPNLSNAEGDDGESIDFLSNGFKWRINSGLRNQSGQSYIYLAIAEQPFKYANAR